MRAPALGLLLVTLFACRGAAPKEEPTPDPGLPLGPLLTLPADLDTMSPAAFEEWVARELPEGRATPIEKPSLHALAAALDCMDLTSVRAAVILGRSLHAANASVLIRRLEQRALGPERQSDCGDCVAAVALARFPASQVYARRMLPLAVGPRPHPDLEVRVECAATALAGGYEEVIPFLLQVLRIDTWDGQKDARDFAVSPTTVWARGRAAEALSLHAGVPLTYQPDGSIEHRQREAARLQELLLPPPPPAATPAASADPGPSTASQGSMR